MKTVLHVGKFYPPVPGGMERALADICAATRGLVENRVLVVNTGPRTVEEDLDGVHVTRVGTVASAGSVPLAPAFAHRLARERADLVVLHEPNPWALLSLSFVRRRAPLVVWYHSDVVRPRLQYSLLYAPLASRVYASAKHFVASSPPLARHAAPLRRYAQRVRVIPFGIDADEWIAASEEDDGFVLFAGRHVAYKGVDVLLRALSGTALRAVIAGDGPMRQRWMREAESLGLGSRITFPGEVPDADLRALMRRCAALVLPSVTRAEAFGYVQLEAMASARPVISTDVQSGVSWVNRHDESGLVVRAGDADALRRALERMMRDPARRRQMGTAGRSRVEREFTIAHMRERLAALYAEHGLLTGAREC